MVVLSVLLLGVLQSACALKASLGGTRWFFPGSKSDVKGV